MPWPRQFSKESNVTNRNFTKTGVCVQVDHTAGIRVRMAADFHISKGGMLVAFHTEFSGHFQHDFAEGAVGVNSAVFRHGHNLGQIDHQLAEVDGSSAKFQPIGLNKVIGFPKTQVAVEGSGGVFALYLCFVAVLALFYNTEFGP